MTLKIAFLENFFTVRGTTLQIYQYAHYNETILGNQSLIITRPFSSVENFDDASLDVYKKFQQRFPVFFYEERSDIQNILDKERPDVLYVIKAGTRDDGLYGFIGVKTLVHCVFNPLDPHGESFAVISQWLNAAFKRHHPVLPHIVHLPETSENLREELGIPKDAIVFGRHGGYNEFDHPDVQRAVRRIVAEGHPIYFVFMNTKPFLPPSPNVFFLPKNTCPFYKAKFIGTCDAMIYGRVRGETFGLAIGEFSIRNKPIFADVRAPDRMHHVILSCHAHWFLSEDDLYRKMITFRPCPEKDWNRYREYSPENVMKTFDDIVRKTLKPKTCYVTCFWDSFVKLPEISPDDEMIAFVHERYADQIPKVVSPNIVFQNIDEEFMERFTLWKRLSQEAAVMNSGAYQQAVGNLRNLREYSDPLYTTLSHCKVEFMGWAAEKMSDATAFAWIDSRENIPSWWVSSSIHHHRINFKVTQPIDPAVDGQVVVNLQKGTKKVNTSFFGGSREALLTYRQIYRNMHEYLLQKGITDDDRHLSLLCYLENPSLLEFIL